MNRTIKQVIAVLFALSAVGFARGERYTTASYVQDGLIGHWDACENAGRGSLNENRTTWADLTGKHADIEFPNDRLLEKDANGIWCYKLTPNQWGGHGCRLTDCADIAEAITNRACTIEIVCDFGAQASDANVLSVLGETNAKRFLWIRQQPNYCLGVAEYLACQWCGNVLNLDKGEDNLNKARSYSMLCRQDGCDFYRNGVSTKMRQPVATGANVIKTPDPQKAVLSIGSWAGSGATDMKVYALRIYDRVLTEAELQTNQAVDAARLFQAHMEDVQQLFVTSDMDLFGEPNPEYGMHAVTPAETLTCEASTPVEKDSLLYTCFGYELYTNAVEDSETWLPWNGPQTGKSVTFTVPRESSVKLVWRWIGLRSAFLSAHGVGLDAVSISHDISPIVSGVGGLDVTLHYGTSPASLDQTVAGNSIAEGGVHEDVFRGFEPGRSYWGKIVFSIGGVTVCETAVFNFATTDRLAYWSLNSRCLRQELFKQPYLVDQSGNGFNLVVNQDHVSFVDDPDAPDGEFAHLDGNSSYLKSTDRKLPFSTADGLTFFFRMRGCANTSECPIFEISSDYNGTPGAIYVAAEARDGKHYLLVGERAVGVLCYALCRSVEPLSDTDWQNIVIVFTKQDAPDCFAVYFDGVRQAVEIQSPHNKSMKGQDYPNQYFYIAGRGGNGKLPCDLDEFGIYGYALNEDAVSRLMADMAGEGGTLFVESADGGEGTSQPTVGAHADFAKGQIVSFERDDFAGVLRTWSIFAYDEARGEWGETCRGYGHCGTFRHTGGKMRLCWNVDTQLPPVCRWTFNDGTGRNVGTFGADCDLEFSGTAAADGHYLSVPKEATAYAVTKESVPLSSANGLTASFWVRNPQKRSTSFSLLELSPDFNKKGGTFMVGYVSDVRKWEISLNPYSIVGYSPSEEDDAMLDGEWHHCTVVYNKRVWPSTDFYIDGVKIETDDAGYNLKGDSTNFKFVDSERLWLCHRDTGNSVQADLDDVTIHPYSLTPTEVAAFYAAECIEKGKPAVTDGMASLVVTAKKAVPKDDLPIPGFGRTCACTAGEKLSFDFTRAPYTVEGRTGKFKLMGWTLYRYEDGEWKVYRTGANPLVEFVHPGGAVKLELNFGIPGLVVFFQ